MAKCSFSELAAEFQKRVDSTVWCTVATVDRKGRPRARILHPIWEGPVGWIATGRNSLKSKHLGQTPFVSCTYWTQDFAQVHAECRAVWEERREEKQRLWQLFGSLPSPLGYDLGLFWKGGPTDPDYGLLRLDPWRVELWSMADLMSGKGSQVWEA